MLKNGSNMGQKRWGQLLRDFAERNKPHFSTISGLTVPTVESGMAISFKITIGIGTRPGPGGQRSRRACYDDFVCWAASMIFPNKGTAGN